MVERDVSGLWSSLLIYRDLSYDSIGPRCLRINLIFSEEFYYRTRGVMLSSNFRVNKTNLVVLGANNTLRVENRLIAKKIKINSHLIVIPNPFHLICSHSYELIISKVIPDFVRNQINEKIIMRVLFD